MKDNKLDKSLAINATIRVKSIIRYEELGNNAWASLQTVLYDGWILRFANGHTGRSNCISPLYQIGQYRNETVIALDSKIKWCEQMFRARDIRPAFKLLNIPQHDELEHQLTNQGYTMHNETSVQTADSSVISSTDNKNSILKTVSVKLEEAYTSYWLDIYNQLHQFTGINAETTKYILDNSVIPRIHCSIVFNSKIAALGFCAIEDEYAGLFGIIVDPDIRGKGYGRLVMHSLMEAALEKGVKKFYLQVTTENKVANNLYASLGFKELYRYRYLVKSL